MYVSSNQTSCIFDIDDKTGTCKLRSNVKFHLYISHTPCGDASIIPIQNKKRKSDITNETNSKVMKLHKTDTARTGGKPVPGEESDPKTSQEYHHIDILRNKPGRGEFTQCMSCSDKIMKWVAIGSQGSLLRYFLSDSIFFTSLVIGKCLFDKSVLERAIIQRIEKKNLLKQHIKIEYANIEFDQSVENAKLSSRKPRACGSALCWSKVPTNQVQVIAANGCPLGLTRKHMEKSTKLCEISGRCFYNHFKYLALLIPRNNPLRNTLNNLGCNSLSYREIKDKSPYAIESKKFKKAFQNWYTHDHKLDHFN